MKLKSLFNILNLSILLVLTNCTTDKDVVIREDLIDQEDDNDDVNTNNDNEPLFEFSIDGTGIDFIKATDPDTFISIEYLGQFNREIPSKGQFELNDPNAYVFEATFTGGKKIGIWCRSNFGSVERATEYANKLTDKLGKLPVFMRDDLNHVAVIDGTGGASAEPDGKFFFIFSERIDERIAGNQLEATVFHETAHVYFEKRYGASTEWLNARQKDGVYMTEYAQRIPDKEDIPETAIFVYTMVKYPGRLSQSIEDWVRNSIPNRYEFLEPFFKD
ncbi:hypothetical protein [Hyunsoonleella pacifica]|uniref:Uncharacterized protein n=1 Tax=Hyunsoonleella pacifica TaxID=1080224 RepID=A0A4Q9FS28_9FLAO|nr:hypothetical protein [Hyunsoonleella pacifica]TBN18763.1 hypothetical protein EYD46_01480 [Hyunsoonleella pacifica]GGD04526.1 hypothetical protein GCM10011368_02970 [Hyunsoonleella pacifica]